MDGALTAPSAPAHEIVAAAQQWLKRSDPRLLPALAEGMREHARTRAVFGKSQSQTATKLISLQLTSASPMRALRQCTAEIEKRYIAFMENSFRMRRLAFQAQQLREQAANLTGPARELVLIDAQEKEWQYESGKDYLEGSVAGIVALIDAYNQIRTAHNIPEKWDERHFEAAEPESHLRALLRLAHREWVASGGRIGAGCLEYGEQFGLHPQALYTAVNQHIAHCNELAKQNQVASIDELYAWIDACVEKFGEEWKKSAKRVGLDRLVTDWALYIEREDAKAAA